jgi:hypothetical protein
VSKKAFNQVMEGLNEALAFARGELKGAKLHVPPEIVAISLKNPDRVFSIRRRECSRKTPTHCRRRAPRRGAT